MQHTDIRKKRRSYWPWVPGVVVLALLLWGVTGLLSDDGPADSPTASADSAADFTRPARIPAPPRAPFRGPSSPSLDQLAPLDQSAVNKQAHATGRIVAIDDDGAWLRTGSRIIRVAPPRGLGRGDSVTVEGRLRSAAGEAAATAIAGDTALQQAVVRRLKLVPDSAGIRRIGPAAAVSAGSVAGDEAGPARERNPSARPGL